MTKIKELTSKVNRNINKIAGNIASMTNIKPTQVCHQILVNKHFRNIGKIAYDQQKEQQDTQKEYKKAFYDRHNGWLS